MSRKKNEKRKAHASFDETEYDGESCVQAGDLEIEHSVNLWEELEVAVGCLLGLKLSLLLTIPY